MINGREIGRILWHITLDLLHIGHTGVELRHRKKGYGKQFTDATVEYARQNNLKMIAEYGFVAMTFNKHQEFYGDIRDTGNLNYINKEII